jgi:phage terminase small subunit
VAKGKTADEAYVLAGYQPSRKNASRLRTSEDISARIEEILSRAAVRAEVSQAQVLAELSKIAFANMLDYMRAGADGDPHLDFSALTRDQAAALGEVTVEDFKDGRGDQARDVRRIKFKLNDKRAALVDIGKHLGMFRDKVELTGKDGGPIQTEDMSDLSDTEIGRRIAFLLTKGAKAQKEQP